MLISKTLYSNLINIYVKDLFSIFFIEYIEWFFVVDTLRIEELVIFFPQVSHYINVFFDNLDLGLTMKLRKRDIA